MTTVDDIKRYINYLPTEDIGFANSFINERRLYDLKELVDSSIIRLKKKITKSSHEERIVLLQDKSSILKLKEAVDSYLSNIDPDYFDEYEPESYYED